MSILTAIQAAIVNKMHPDAQKVALGDSIRETQRYAPVAINYEIAADATGAPTAFTAPFAMDIVDIIVQARATSSAATVSPINAGTGSGTDIMCTAIACATDGVVSHMAAGADDAQLRLEAGDVIKVDASAAAVRALITFVGVRV